MKRLLRIAAIVFAGFCTLSGAVKRNEDSPDGRLLAADTVARARAAISEGADVNVQDEVNGQTPIMRATLHGWTTLVKFLLDQGADCTIGEKDGYTPAHGAGFQGRAKIMSLLKEHGVDIYAPAGKDAFTPFHRACWGREERHTDTIEYLLSEGGVKVNVKGGHDKRTCFQMTPNENTKTLLVKYGAGNTEL
jgi:ankyrin repeat protein